MAECTGIDLRKARESAGMPLWQAAQALAVAESTLKRWEHDECVPQSVDVNRMEHLYKLPGLWHRWMRSNDDAYREHYPEELELHALPSALMKVRYQMEDMQRWQGLVERDAIDGIVDDPRSLRAYLMELESLQAALSAAQTKAKEALGDA
nr:MAG TPA: antitoxin [Caudoviricetes sp.]